MEKEVEQEECNSCYFWHKNICQYKDNESIDLSFLIGDENGRCTMKKSLPENDGAV